MINLKKLTMTLALLITAAAGAWATDVLYLEIDGTAATLKYGNAGSNIYFIIDGNHYNWSDDQAYKTTWPTMTSLTVDASCKNFQGTGLNGLFKGFSSVPAINGIENLNTSEATTMQNMFTSCSSLTSLDLSSFNTAKVTTTSGMFIKCSSLTSLDLSSFNTANVTSMQQMFENCSSLTTLDLTSFNTAKVAWMSYMFNNCSNLEYIYVGDGWDTAALNEWGGQDTFASCTKLPNWDGTTSATKAFVGEGGYLSVKPEPAGIELTSEDGKVWTLAEGLLTGDAVLEVTYYDDAAAAGVTAAEGVAAGTGDKLVTEGTTEDGTLMYAIGTSETAAPAEGWTETVPTTAGMDFEEETTVYVWYYVVGNDEHSDSEPAVVAVTVKATPAFDVTFAEGTNEDGKWSTSPESPVKAGQTVTVSYKGERKAIGVKAEKKAEAPAGPVAWDSSVISEINVDSDTQFSRGGITLSASGTCTFKNGDILLNNETLTFTAPEGMKFTRIKITATSISSALGEGGWGVGGNSLDWNSKYNGKDPSATVDLKGYSSKNITGVSSIEFTFE